MRGTIKAINYDGTVTLQLTEKTDISDLVGKDLSIDIKPWKDKRSRSANALLWSCLGEIASALGGDKWDYYIQALRSYGKYTMISIKEEALREFQASYRECEVIGSHNGYVDLLIYFGSSTYDSKEFAVLLDGVIDDMKSAGIPTPTSAEMKRAIAMLDKGGEP